MRTQTRRDGFTLIELMIAVAIVGVLAAMGISGFRQYQMRSKRTEAMSNIAAIVKTEIAYFGTNGTFHATTPVPAGVPTPVKKTWDVVSHAEFDPLGYAPEGTVWYSYEVNANPADCACGVGANGEALCFTASAYGDLDGDGGISVISYFYTDPAGNTCVTAIGTNPPPLNPSTGNPILDTPTYIPVGPGADDF
jgi:prepilin-type N-terminal cleavage/methylation domain-containing protein